LPQPSPESRTSRSFGTKLGIIELLNAGANPTPTAPTTKAMSTIGIVDTSPDLPNQSSAEPTTSSTPKPAIQGLRRPVASAMAPRTGENSAMKMPAAPVAKPQSACPRVASPTTADAKYG